jgi:hypothetical protein
MRIQDGESGTPKKEVILRVGGPSFNFEVDFMKAREEIFCNFNEFFK